MKNNGVNRDPDTEDVPLLVAEDIEAGYDRSQVLYDIDFKSRQGVTCIFGPNGSGKSTFLKCLNGVVPVWSGSVRYGGEELTQLRPEEIVTQGIVTLPQGGGIFGNLSVDENLRVGGFTVNNRDVIEARMEEILDAFPVLQDKLGQKARDLSGGQQMMVSLGRAMMTGAGTYLLDEPSAGLAPQLVEDTLELIDRLVERGARVILVEQNVRAAMTLADHVYILAEGKVQFEGPPDDLSEEEQIMDLYLGI